MQESHGDLSSVTAADLETACVRWAGRPANLFAEEFAEIAAAPVAGSPSVRSSDFRAAEALGAARLVPVVSVADAADAVPLGRALLAGGATVIEVVLRTPAALDALGAISRDLGDQIGVGAGTVLTIPQAERAVECGAKFIVSPGLNPELVRWCNARGVPIVPGVATPTEIEARCRRDAAEMPPRGRREAPPTCALIDRGPPGSQAARNLGLTAVKFFPAEAIGGVKSLKAPPLV